MKTMFKTFELITLFPDETHLKVYLSQVVSLNVFISVRRTTVKPHLQW